MELPITNITDLRLEIARLKQLEQVQSAAIGERFRNPAAALSTIFSIFRRPATADGSKSSSFFDQDIVGLISRFLLPFTLNKTIFRNSGFVVKTLVGLVSQKASHFISEETVTSLWEKVASLFKRKPEEQTPEHKGIPPLSETY